MSIERIEGTDLWSVPRHLYCGPAAACVLTGLPYKDAVRPALNRAKGRERLNQGIMGLSYKHLLAALLELGWTCEPCAWLPPVGRFTLRLFLELAEERSVGWPMLVHVTGHFVAAHRGIVADNTEVKPAAAHWCRRRLVRHAWTVRSEN